MTIIVGPAVGAFGQEIGGTIDCSATIEAWRHDVSLKQFMLEHECSCSDGNASPPVCVSNNSAAMSSTGGSHKQVPSDEVLVLKEIQNYMDQQFRVNSQVYRKYQQEGIRNAAEINQEQQTALRSAEQRQQHAARQEAALRDKQAMTVHNELLGMPSAEKEVPGLNLTGVLEEDTRRRRSTECQDISEKITRYENGLRHIDDVMARNERMMRDAVEDGEKAAADLSNVSAEATAEALSMGLKSFVQTGQNLQNMRNVLDKYGKGNGVTGLSYAQIQQAKKWLDKGLEAGGRVADLTEKSIAYYNSTPLRDSSAAAASPYSEKLKLALKDFNDKFMHDAGGWEFVGEHLAGAGGGPAGEIAFKAAVVGIKATAAGIGMKISKDQLLVFNENQHLMVLERIRIEQRVEKLKADLANRHCFKP